jgi:hypothetical protein
MILSKLISEMFGLFWFPVSSFLASDILPSTLRNTFQVCSFHRFREQVSYQRKITGNIAYFNLQVYTRCIQTFPDWPPGARTANGIALCHWVQLYRYFVSQSSEFCRRNPLCCFSTSVYCCLFRYRLRCLHPSI